MEAEGVKYTQTTPYPFTRTVLKARNGDKKSMEDLLDLFAGDIEYLAKFIMLPREEAVQVLKTELINIIYELN